MERAASQLGELAYLDEGDGEVVLLLHGWPVDSPCGAASFRCSLHGSA